MDVRNEGPDPRYWMIPNILLSDRTNDALVISQFLRLGELTTFSRLDLAPYVMSAGPRMREAVLDEIEKVLEPLGMSLRTNDDPPQTTDTATHP